ncbi:MAG: hypothetical protein AB7L28_15155, partial [Kofleriaceae bacterium]
LSREIHLRKRELAETRQLLDEARGRVALPVLDNIRVASPCSARWEDMTGDERVRACGACSKNVYNLSDMTRAQAEALIIENEGRLCVRYFQRADGTILLKDCSVAVSRRRRKRVLAVGLAAGLAGSLLGYEALQEEPEPRYVMMGGMGGEPDHGAAELNGPPANITRDNGPDEPPASMKLPPSRR